ncbi:hypothetical protein BS78_09G077200 [Paspalum vaginatum]|nr:hypothetical protein BS78_09G077200 [Paspalum vaginatum]
MMLSCYCEPFLRNCCKQFLYLGICYGTAQPVASNRQGHMSCTTQQADHGNVIPVFPLDVQFPLFTYQHYYSFANYDGQWQENPYRTELYAFECGTTCFSIII